MECRDFENAYCEAEMDLDRLKPESREHLRHCDNCRRKTESERQLLKTLEMLAESGAEEHEKSILSIISERSRHQSYLGILPVATSALILVGGILSWGGLPAGHIIGELPGQALHSLTDLLNIMRSSLEAGVRAAGAASRILPAFWELSAAILSLGGLVLSAAIYRRWKQRWTPHF